MKILVLAKSGFGKTTSWTGREKLGIKGLNPEETFVLQCTNRAIPSKYYPLSGDNKNRAQITVGNFGLDAFQKIANGIEYFIANPKYNNLVIDDFNYLSQDYYMANAMKGGWDKSECPCIK